MEDEVVGWLTGPRSAVYHPDQAHADSLSGDAGQFPVTAAEVEKFDLKPCSRCASPKHNEVPENVAATAAALITMFVVDGTEDEIHQMAQDFLDDLAEHGYRVTKIPQRRVENIPTEGTGFDVLAIITEPIDFSGVDDVDTPVPADQCSHFNGSARRCALSVDHDGEHIYLITTTPQEGSTE